MPKSRAAHVTDRPSDGFTRRQFGLCALAAFASAGLAVALPEDSASAVSRVGPTRGAPKPSIPESFPRAWALTASGWAPSVTGKPGPSDAQKRQWFRTLVQCGARTLYVSGTGNDGNPGTESAPFRQISRAVAEAKPGDLILVDSGTYGYTELRGITGSPSAWVGIMSRTATSKAVITVPPPTDNFVNVIDSQFVGLYGFTVVGDQQDSNTNGSGISVYGNSHHIAIWNNEIHDFPGGGVNCFDVDGSHDMVDISYNTIHGTSRYSPSNTSGVSIYASRDLTAGETFPDGYGYRIVGNYIYDVVCQVPFTPGGYDCVTDGNGISLDCIETTYGYRKPILVAGNIITGCGGRGVLAYNSINIDIIGNTSVGNLRTNSPAINGGAELQSKSDKTVRIIGNVILPTNTPTTADSLGDYKHNVFLGGTHPVPAGNNDRRGVGKKFFCGPLSRTLIDNGTAPSRYATAAGRAAPRCTKIS